MIRLFIISTLLVSFIATESYGQALDKVLLAKSKNGTFEEIKELVEKGANVNAQDEKGQSVLIFAVANQNYQTVKFLIDRGAEVNHQSENLKMTPLHAAVRWGKDPAIVRLLIDNRAKIDAEIKNLGTTPLLDAIKYNSNIEIVKMLIEAGANINHKASGRSLPMHWAVEYGRTEIAKLLLSEGAKFDTYTGVMALDYTGCTPLLIASMRGRKSMAKLLIDAGADVNAGRKLDYNRTPLFYANKRGYNDIIKLLLDAGADLEIAKGETDLLLQSAFKNALNPELKDQIIKRYISLKNFNQLYTNIINEWHQDDVDQFTFATRYGNIELMQYLVNKKVDYNKRSVVKINEEIVAGSPLCIATALNDLDKVKYLVEDLNQDVNEIGMGKQGKDKGFTPLIMASINDEKEIVDYLLQNGADIEGTDGKFKSKALIWASYYNKTAMVRHLIEKGANINAINGNGNNALHQAISKGNTEIVNLLIDQKIEFKDVKLPEGKSVDLITLASFFGNPEILKELVKKGVELDQRSIIVSGNISYGSPLCAAAGSGKLENVRYLVEELGMDIEEKEITTDGTKGWTPLIAAAANGNLNVVKYLVNKGANINADGAEESALFMATRNQKYDVVEYLLSKGADVDKPDENAMTPLMWAAYSGNENMFNLLIEHKASVNLKDINNNNALFYTFSPDTINKNIAKTLIPVTDDVMSYKTRSGQNLLHLAAIKGDPYICQLLIDKGMHPNSIDEKGSTPLHYAAGWGRLSICKYLVSQKANVNAKNNKNQTPLDAARNYKHSSVINYLEKEMGINQNVNYSYSNAYFTVTAINDGKKFKLVLPDGITKTISVYGTKTMKLPNGTKVYSNGKFLGTVGTINAFN